MAGRTRPSVQVTMVVGCPPWRPTGLERKHPLMNAVLSTAGGWAVALAIAVPILILFWWARRNAPAGDYQMDYSVSRRTRPQSDGAVVAAPTAPTAVDAPVPANPAVLAPPTEAAVPPASTVTLPPHAPLPPEPASVQTPAPPVK